MKIDLNCDMGELEDAAHEAALMQHITSANIACGGHAGDDATMERTARLAMDRGVRIGAHPSFLDRKNFGRIDMPQRGEVLADIVYDQLLRLDSIVKKLGGKVEHVKPHGALYNVAVKDMDVATAIGVGVLRWNPFITMFGLAGSGMVELWSSLGMKVAGEGFADRRYESDGTLRSRQFADALITDPKEAAAQAVRLSKQGTVQTICVHGDTPGSVEILKACREALSCEE